MFKYKLLISYDGTAYGGWQVQPNSISIQTLVEQALSTILRRPTRVQGSGRTDAGVHALGQVAHFVAEVEIDTRKLLLSLNGLLPDDIRVLTLESVHPDFHARFSATGKIYRYHVKQGTLSLPFERLYSWHVRPLLDLEALKAAAHAFVGTHDFISFSNEAHKGSAARDPIRTLKRVDFLEEPGGFYLELEANGFLYKMARNIVGTLIEVGKSKIAPEEIPTLLALRDRRQVPSPAPAHGLFLVQVIYQTNCESSLSIPL